MANMPAVVSWNFVTALFLHPGNVGRSQPLLSSASPTSCKCWSKWVEDVICFRLIVRTMLPCELEDELSSVNLLFLVDGSPSRSCSRFWWRSQYLDSRWNWFPLTGELGQQRTTRARFLDKRTFVLGAEQMVRRNFSFPSILAYPSEHPATWHLWLRNLGVSVTIVSLICSSMLWMFLELWFQSTWKLIACKRLRFFR